MNYDSNYYKKEPLVNRLVSEFVSNASYYTIRTYTPYLGTFNVLIDNRYVAMLRCIPQDVTRMVTLDTWRSFCHGILRSMMHIINHPLYRMAGYTTDNPSKVIHSITENCEIDTWLIDVCREVARPMARDRILYVPYLPKPYALARDRACYMYGLDLEQTVRVTGALKALKEIFFAGMSWTCRSLMKEDVTIAALAVTDGEFLFADPEMATWRFQASRLLSHFINGCLIPTTDRPQPPQVFEPWIATMVSLSDIDPEAVLETNFVPTPPMYQPQPERAMDAYHAAISTQNFITPEGARILVYYTIDRAVTYNAWLDRAESRSTSIPPIVYKRSLVRDLLHAESRFPTEDKHSKTPVKNDPQGTVNSKVPKPKGFRKKVKYDTLPSPNQE
jgi:hypothetical protein